MFLVMYGFRSPSLVSYIRSPPNSNNFQLSESTCRCFFQQINFFLFNFFEISAGKDLKLLVLVCNFTFSHQFTLTILERLTMMLSAQYTGNGLSMDVFSSRRLCQLCEPFIYK